ncbi:MAG: GntR family transcriptional regulator, partial [Pseudomonadota bacterium]|nr:GntR family transcriptional regulator [Pseudomonadota bacterium]
MPINQIAPKRLADTIVEQLETMILEGTLEPGQRLPPERVLAEQFGVSRPSLREAVQRLAAKGLLKSRQGGGNYVAENLGSSFSDPLIPLLE